MEVTVVVATFGAERWRELAHDRAAPSAREAGATDVVLAHGPTLHEARNDGLAAVETEWACFLDADDELEPGFFDHMAAGCADLRAPSVRYVRPDGTAQMPVMPRVAGHGHECVAECLRDGNWLVIGTVARTALLKAVGGFRSYEWSEDWDLWQRCWLHGASVAPVPRAIYRAHVRFDSRNRAPDQRFRNAVHHLIRRTNLPHLYREA